MDDLTNLLAAYYDGYPNFFSLEEDDSWHGSDHVIKLTYTDRDRFNEFQSFLDGRWSSWHEDDHNIFNLKPFVIDIGHSDMVIIFNNDIKKPNW